MCCYRRPYEIRSVPAIVRSLLIMLEGLCNETHLCSALIHTWLLHAVQRGDLIRILEPVLKILLHPDTARYLMSSFYFHKRIAIPFVIKTTTVYYNGI